ncbi:hypothetical protein NL529_33060, partial [Klebsiella pneumoniae]|nr:hypothetical protein [Klebsiella pneumoniae]
ILAMVEDADGDIWASCSGASRKLVRIRDGKIVEQFPASRVPLGRMAADPSKGIYIGPRDGPPVLLRDGVVRKIPAGSPAS